MEIIASVVLFFAIVTAVVYVVGCIFVAASAPFVLAYEWWKNHKRPRA